MTNFVYTTDTVYDTFACGFSSSDVIQVFSPSLYWIVGIRQLQLMLLKVALLLGIEIHVNAEFKGLIEPPEDQETESKS